METFSTLILGIFVGVVAILILVSNQVNGMIDRTKLLKCLDLGNTGQVCVKILENEQTQK